MSAPLTSEPIFRVLARQPLSIGLEGGTQINLTIQGTPCALSIRPVHDAPSDQQVEGSSLIAIEFARTLGNGDLLIASREGLELIEDFLSAVSVVEGVTFRPVQLLQVGRFVSGTSENCEFVQFLSVPSNHWGKSISGQTIKHVRNLVAHWDGLEKGHRLRRAARQYRDAIGNFDDLAAFQDAYIGLEAMEPPPGGCLWAPAGHGGGAGLMRRVRRNFRAEKVHPRGCARLYKWLCRSNGYRAPAERGLEADQQAAA